VLPETAPRHAIKPKQQNGKIMKSKNMRTLLSLTITNMIVVLNMQGQTLKLAAPQMLRVQLAQSQPTPVINVPVQPGKIIPPGEPEVSGTNQPSWFTNSPSVSTN
jgi:hypothetical protein